jgi:hypothetical protein
MRGIAIRLLIDFAQIWRDQARVNGALCNQSAFDEAFVKSRDAM